MKTMTRTIGAAGIALALLLSVATAGDMKAVLDSGGKFIVLSSASNELLRVQSNGDVSIGTPSPLARLHIQTANTNDNHVLTVSDTARAFSFYMNLGAGSGNPIARPGDQGLIFNQGSPGSGAFLIAPWNTQPSGVRLNGSGDIGIGVSVPRTNSMGGIVVDVAGPVAVRNANIGTTDFSDATWTSGGGGVMGWNKSGGQGELSFVSISGGGSDGGFSFYDRNSQLIRITKAGNVGIGTSSPSGKLQVQNTVGSPTIFDNASDHRNYIRGTNYFDSGDLSYFAGNVGIGTTAPSNKLDVVGGITTRRTTGADVGGTLTLGSGYCKWQLIGNQWNGGDVMLRNPAGQDVIYCSQSGGSVGIGTTTPQATLHVAGNAKIDGTNTVKVLSITGGADVAEPFGISGGASAKGSVVVIDDEHQGQLKLSDRAYDKRVAGIVSGAGGVNPGLTLSQQGVIEGGQNVALSGRVYVLADASNGAIQPGDLLTTSDTPGHAMKVTDHAQAQGAVLGKAMSRLESGKGLVLVLVTLQ